jgi:hypothetical protein
MKNTSTPSERARRNSASVGSIATDRASRSHAAQPHAPSGSASQGPPMMRPKSSATITSQLDSAVSSTSSTSAGRRARGAFRAIQSPTSAQTTARSRA